MRFYMLSSNCSRAPLGPALGMIYTCRQDVLRGVESWKETFREKWTFDWSRECIHPEFTSELPPPLANSGVFIFQKVFVSSLPILPSHYNSSPYLAHIFIVPSLISSPISIVAKFFPNPTSRELARIYTPAVAYNDLIANSLLITLTL